MNSSNQFVFFKFLQFVPVVVQGVFVISTYESSHLHNVYYKKWNILQTIERIYLKFSEDNQIQVLNRINISLAPPMSNPNRLRPKVNTRPICKFLPQYEIFFLAFDTENDNSYL